MFKKILVPIDGTEVSDRAMSQSLALAKPLGATVLALVIEPPAPLPSTGAAIAHYSRDAAEHDAKVSEHARAILNRFAEQAAAAGVAFEPHEQQDDDIDATIVKTAERNGADLIVMITHGRGALGELLFGSHTKNVLSRTKVPLLVLR